MSNFIDISNEKPRSQIMWPSIVITKEEIALEIERLLDADKPANGRRASSIVHPSSVSPGKGLAPGTAVTISVLKPGESTFNRRVNSTQVEITLSGSGTAMIGESKIKSEKWDVWNIPSMQIHNYKNSGSEPWVRLSYSNSPVLEKLEAHFVEEFEGMVPPSDEKLQDSKNLYNPNDGPRARDLALNEEISEDGARLLGYEWLIDIDAIESKTHHWSWQKISKYLPDVSGLDSKYNGRRLYVLYNPATERRIGTTESFFATISCSPPGNNYIPHRHSSSAINYYLRGEGFSEIEGTRLDWKAGDLLLSAPSMVMHSHHSTSTETSALTIQDHPFHIGMNSLVWQENMNEKIRTLGNEQGFVTNRASL